MGFKTKEIAAHYYRERRKKKREYLAKLKEKPCADCGEKYPHYVMEFDHVPEKGQKKFSVASGGNWSLSAGPLKQELDKCDIVCANCHRVRTYNRLNK